MVLLPDQLFDLAQQFGIANHLQMGGEDGGILRPELVLCRPFVFFDLSADGVDGLLESLEFNVNGANADESVGNAKVLGSQDQRRPDHDTG